ncbi:unnamed protein product [Closterium sp. NIES-65]|nr:unnamed protein product [Closterium sp. NIES-65]
MMTSQADQSDQKTGVSEKADKPAPTTFADKLEAFSQEKFASFRAAVSSPNLLTPEKPVDTPEEQEAKVTARYGQDQVKALREAIGPLAGRAKLFCTDACLRRYLRARGWNVAKAEKMLRDTLRWRHVYRPEEITWEDVAEEAATGKVYRTEFLDKQGRAVIVMSAGRQNTAGHAGQVRHLVYALENAINHLPAGTAHSRMVWFIDFRGWTLRKAPPLKTSREVLSILQNHYPERLGQAVVYDPPPVFETFWKMIRPFVDPTTFKKILFVYPNKPATIAQLEEIFDLEHLDQGFGGRSTWAFELPVYSQAMRADDARAQAFWGIPASVIASPRRRDPVVLAADDDADVPTDVDAAAGAEAGEGALEGEGEGEAGESEGGARAAAEGQAEIGQVGAEAGLLSDSAGAASLAGQEAGAVLSEAENGGRADEGYSVTVGGAAPGSSDAAVTAAAAAGEMPEQEREERNGSGGGAEEQEQDGSFWLPLNEPAVRESVHAQNIAHAHHVLKSTFSKMSIEFKKPAWMQR